MKPLALALALAATADLLLRHGRGMQAVLVALIGVGHAIGGWVYYGGR